MSRPIGFDFHTPLPFKVILNSGELECVEAVRVLTGRRMVCRARWHGDEVFAKLFAPNSHAASDWRAEHGNYHRLREAGVSMPDLLHAQQQASPECAVLVYRSLAPAPTAKQLWTDLDESGREPLLRRLVQTLAMHHAAGVIQDDPHLENFMVADERLYSLDAGGFAILGGPPEPYRALDNLGLLFAQLPVEYDKYAIPMLAAYREAGGPAGEVPPAQLSAAIGTQRKRRLEKFRKKIMRECSAFIERHSWGHKLMVARQYASAGVWRYLDDPERAFADGERYLKSGNSATVTGFEVDDIGLVVKRYNLKDFGHRLRRCWRPSRAACSWRNANLLRFLEIATAEPVAMLETRFGPFRGRAYFFMRHVVGVDLFAYMTSALIAEADKQAMSAAVACLFRRLASNKIAHGDMKASNIIVENGKPVLIDLDAMQLHGKAAKFIPAFQRDLDRFFQNWNEHAETHAMFARAFESDQLPDGLRIPAL